MSFVSSTENQFAGIANMRTMNAKQFAEMVGMSNNTIEPIPRSTRVQYRSDDEDFDGNDNLSNEFSDDDVPLTKRKRAVPSRARSPEPFKMREDGRNPDNSDLDSTILSSPDPSDIDSDDADDLYFFKRGVITPMTDFNSLMVFPPRCTTAENEARAAIEKEKNKIVIAKGKRRARMGFKHDFDVLPTGEPVVQQTLEEIKARRKGKSCYVPGHTKRKYQWKDANKKNKDWLKGMFAKRQAEAEEKAKAERLGMDFY